MEVQIRLDLFKTAKVEFEQFLELRDNDRILFSGKFGSGKTTFLKEFFKFPNGIDVENNKYEVFRISPVHYSISGNEDVIELIKYDILTEFLVKEIEIYTSDFPSYNLISSQDIKSILVSSVSMIEFKGIGLGKIIDELKKLKKKLDDRKESIDEGDIFSNFLNEVESQQNIYQRDIVTKTIEHVITRLKSEVQKEVILVIDDLDRIDPDHIFRILNVFSAHFDDEIYQKRGLKNKFGFDKVVIIGDYDNIKSVFSNRYGSSADFQGYINKFFSKSVFRFDLKKNIKDYFLSKLHSMNRSVVDKYRDSFRYFGTTDNFLEGTLIQSVLLGFLPVRAINRLDSQNIELMYKELNYLVHHVDSRRDVYSLLTFKINLFLQNGTDNYFNSVKKLLESHANLQLDTDVINLIYKTEKTINLQGSNNISDVRLKTTSGYFVFEFEKGTPKEIVSKMYLENSQPNYHLSNNDILVIIKAFTDRIKQLVDN